MKRAICITGTPGTGKTMLAKALAKHLKYTYVDVNQEIKKYRLFEGYDSNRKTKIVDEKILISHLEGIIKKHKGGLIIDSHMSHFLPAKFVQLCIITKCELAILKKRLTKRRYTKAKVRENLDAEIFDTCLVEAKANKHNVLVVDTSRSKAEELVQLISL